MLLLTVMAAIWFRQLFFGTEAKSQSVFKEKEVVCDSKRLISHKLSGPLKRCMIALDGHSGFIKV